MKSSRKKQQSKKTVAIAVAVSSVALVTVIAVVLAVPMQNGAGPVSCGGIEYVPSDHEPGENAYTNGWRSLGQYPPSLYFLERALVLEAEYYRSYIIAFTIGDYNAETGEMIPINNFRTTFDLSIVLDPDSVVSPGIVFFSIMQGSAQYPSPIISTTTSIEVVGVEIIIDGSILLTYIGGVMTRNITMSGIGATEIQFYVAKLYATVSFVNLVGC